jgi:hypothetical protein
VLKLVESLKKDKHLLFFDNFFSSYNLFNSLHHLGIKLAGTIRLNRFPKVPIIDDTELTNLGRGSSYEVSFKDNKIVCETNHQNICKLFKESLLLL